MARGLKPKRTASGSSMRRYLRELAPVAWGRFDKKIIRKLIQRCPICWRRFNNGGDHDLCEATLRGVVASGAGRERRANNVLRLAILRRDAYRCRYCTRKVAVGTAHIDHLVPWKNGGRTLPQNLVTSCGPCNMRKRAIEPSPADLFWVIDRGRPLVTRWQAIS